MKALIYSDGASSGNPGKSGIGAVVTVGGRAYELSRFIGVTTNNVAEYTALIAALEKALDLGASEAEVFLDSELLVRQINGIYKVKHENLKPLFGKCVRLLGRFSRSTVRHIPREQNRRADALSKKGIKAGEKQKTKTSGESRDNPAPGQQELF